MFKLNAPNTSLINIISQYFNVIIVHNYTDIGLILYNIHIYYILGIVL